MYNNSSEYGYLLSMAWWWPESLPFDPAGLGLSFQLILVEVEHSVPVVISVANLFL